MRASRPPGRGPAPTPRVDLRRIGDVTLRRGRVGAELRREALDAVEVAVDEQQRATWRGQFATSIPIPEAAPITTFTITAPRHSARGSATTTMTRAAGVVPCRTWNSD